MPTLAFDAEARGVDEAVGQIARIEAAQEQAAQSTNRRFAQTVDQIQEEIEFQRLRGEAVAREAARERAASDAAVAAARSRAEGLRQAARAQAEADARTTAAATSAIQFTQRIQSAASAVTSLASALGAPNSTTGLIGHIAGTTAQFAQMGAAFGPQGAVVGGIIGAAIPAFTALSTWIDNTRSESIRLRDANQLVVESFDTVLARARSAREAQAQAQRLANGFGSLEEQRALRDTRRQEADAIQEAIDRNRRILGGAGSIDEQSGASNAIPVLERELARVRAQYREAERALRMAEQDAAGDEADLMASLQASAQGPAAEAPSRGRGGGGARSAGRSASEIDAERNALRARFAGPIDGIDNGADLMLAAGGDGGSGLLGDIIGDNQAGAAAMADQIKLIDEAAERTAELTEASKEAQRAFGEGWTSSLDEVAASFREANAVMRAAGQGSISTGRLMERSLVAVGNNIADTIGGTMKGAFEDALGAWMDGSKSFVQAAEDMVKGVVKALVIESIVQAVTEFARGVASLASQDYVAAPQHFAAAAAWAAVGVVAGGVGAGIGAFGGGGGDKGGSAATGAADSRSLARDSVREADMAAPITINVYPGGFVTKDDVAGGVLDAVNRAGRNGGRFNPALLRGSGS